MLPKYKQAEQYRQAVIEKEKQIGNLKLELEEATARPIYSDNASDAAYWKDRYESILASIG